jgi:hypothetical protein
MASSLLFTLMRGEAKLNIFEDYKSYAICIDLSSKVL